MLNVVVLGSGNVGQHLIKALKKLPVVNLVQVYARRPEALNKLPGTTVVTNDINMLLPADLYIIAVKDDAVKSLSSSLPFNNRLVAHTSGSLGLNAINSKNRSAVFYPLQTFSKQRDINFETVPLCLEAENQADHDIINRLAKQLSKNVYVINTTQRQALHVAAVFASNFVNHMYSLSAEICTENNMSFDILKPLIQETANKISTLAPDEAQTGPAARNDINTIKKHTDFLKGSHITELYTLLSQSIQAHAKKL